MLSHDAIANLNQDWVATSVPPTYNKTNSSNNCNVARNKLQKFLFILLFHYTRNCTLFYLEIIQRLNLFQSQYLFLHIFFSHFIIQICHECVHHLCLLSETKFPIFASTLHYQLDSIISSTFQYPTHWNSYVMAVGRSVKKKKLFHLTLILPFVDSSFGVGWWL